MSAKQLRAGIREAESDAELFASVGLGWLSEMCTRKANRMRNQAKSNRKPRRPSAEAFLNT